jgi:hypothetical protein
MSRRPSIWRHSIICALVAFVSLSANITLPIHNYNQPLGVLDADIREERVMNLIEKKNLFIAKRAVSFIIASLALIILAGLVSAFSMSLDQSKEGKPNFTGIWKAESLTIVSGERHIPPSYEKEKIEIDHKDPELKIIKSIEGTDKKAELSYTIGAEERAMAFGTDTIRSKAAWNGKQLIITSQFVTEQGSAELKEIWDLEDDRKTLISTRELLGSMWKMVFKKQ